MISQWAFAQATEPTAASDCESKAVSKAGKPLHGAAKATFMKKCTGSATTGGKAKTSQQNKMVNCNKEAKGKTGDDRKAFMKECLSK
jgi:hypothetical protein